jgi:tetraacyldisaccharide 4'-kinase
MAIAGRNRRFDRGIGVQRIDRPVVSVGNLTTGGTGKTPMVAWIAQYLARRARKPVIAMRGYKARPGEIGDEEAEYRALLPDVAVLANPDRAAALGDFLPQHPEIDCVVLDDGFQHRRLHRDLDIVLIDATADTLRGELLPAGNLREPVDAMARADAVIVTHATEFDARLADDIERWHGKVPLAWARHVWTQIWTRCNEPRMQPEPVSWLRGKRVVTMLGVGNPRSIIAQTEAAGAHIMANIPADDHERYDRAKLITARGLCDGADALLVTRKDWVKIEPLLRDVGGWKAPIVVPQLEIEFIAGAETLQAALLEVVRGGEGAAR